MNYKKSNNKIFVKIFKDDFINEKLLEVAKKEGIKSGWINGIGAIKNVEIGYYDLNAKEYMKKKFKSHYELVSLIGNISLVNDKPFIHTHISFSDTEYKMFGGHLFDAQITAAGEFFISLSDFSLSRKLNCDIGLALWDI